MNNIEGGYQELISESSISKKDFKHSYLEPEIFKNDNIFFL